MSYVVVLRMNMGTSVFLSQSHKLRTVCTNLLFNLVLVSFAFFILPGNSEAKIMTLDQHTRTGMLK